MNKRMLYWARRRDFNQVMATLRELESPASAMLGIRPNVYTLNAVMNACVLCQQTDEVVAELWSRMTVAHGIKPNTITYNIKLKRLFHREANDTMDRARQVLKEMEEQRVYPDLTTYNELLNICVENGDMTTAKQFLASMEEQGIEPDVTTYTTMIKGYGIEGQPASLDKAFECLKAMKDRRLTLNRYTCNVLADACIRCGQPSRALKVLREYEDQPSTSGQEEDMEDGKLQRLQVKSFNICLKAYREMGDVRGGFKVLEEMRAIGGLLPNAVTYNTLIDSCSRTGHMPAARSLLSEMEREHIPVDHQTINPFLYGEIVAAGASVDEALNLTTSLLSRYNLKAGNGTIMSVLEAYTDMERPGDAIEAFIRLSEGRRVSAILYNCLIKAYREYALEMKSSDEVEPIVGLVFHLCGPATKELITTPAMALQSIIHVTEKMKKDRLTPDAASYNALLDFTAELGDWSSLLLLEQRRKDAGFKTDHWVIHAKMKCLAEMGNLEGVMSVKDEMEWRSISSNEYTFSVLTMSLLKCGSVDQAEDLLRAALVRGVPVHESLPIKFMFHFAQTGQAERLRKLLAMLKDRLGVGSANLWEGVLGSFAILGDVEQCENSFQAMVKKVGSRPSRKSFLYMVRASCVGKDPERAVAWLERMKRARYPVDEAYSWALTACVVARDASRLHELLSAMEKDGVKSDRLTARLQMRIMEVLTLTLRESSAGIMGRLQKALEVSNGVAKEQK